MTKAARQRLGIGATMVLGALLAWAISTGSASRASTPVKTSIPDTRDSKRSQSDAKRPRLPAKYPNSVSFWNSQDGIAGGGYVFEGSPGTVQLTRDGGKTWHVVLRTRGGVAWVQTAGKHDAWAQVQRRRHTMPFFHSTDGGRTWHRLPKTQVWSPSFISPEHGLAVTGGSSDYGGQVLYDTKLVETLDGGKTWRHLPTPCSSGKPDYYEGMVVTLAPRGRAWAICVSEGAVGSQGRWFFGSSDSGHTWHKIKPSRPRSGIGGAYPWGLSFGPGGTGFAWGDATHDVTTNGGSRWHDTIHLETNNADVLSRKRLFALAYKKPHEALLRSLDGGRTWHVVHSWSG